MFNSFWQHLSAHQLRRVSWKRSWGVIDGFPSGITIDEEFVQQELNRRRPGQSIPHHTTQGSG